MAPTPVTPRRRRWRRGVLATAATAIALLWFTGCTATLTPPTAVAEPVEVYLLLDARHRGCVLPDPQGRLVEYGYGDWSWYAKLEDHWTMVFRTVLWPTRGTLGRRDTKARDLASLRDRFPWMEITPIRVERQRATTLFAGLEAAYAKHAAEEVYNSRYRFHFVPHDDPYWAFHNCNDEVAEWFGALGCHVGWVPLCLDLAVAK